MARAARRRPGALALRFPAIDTAPMASLGGQISPPGSRHKSGGWRVLSTPVDIALAAVEHPNGPEVWAGLLAELAAELRGRGKPPGESRDQVADEAELGRHRRAMGAPPRRPRFPRR